VIGLYIVVIAILSVWWPTCEVASFRRWWPIDADSSASMKYVSDNW